MPANTGKRLFPPANPNLAVFGGSMNKLSEEFIASLCVTLVVVAWLVGLWLLVA